MDVARYYVIRARGKLRTQFERMMDQEAATTRHHRRTQHLYSVAKECDRFTDDTPHFSGSMHARSLRACDGNELFARTRL